MPVTRLTLSVLQNMVLIIVDVTLIIAGGSVNHQLLRMRRMFPRIRRKSSRL